MGKTSLEAKFFTIIVKVESTSMQKPEFYSITGIEYEEEVLKQVFKLNEDETKSVDKIFSTSYRGVNHLYGLVVSGGRVRIEIQHRMDFSAKEQTASNQPTGGIY